MVDVGEPPSSGVGGIDKRTLLIGALLIGGGIGAFVYISRKASAPSNTAENKAQTDVPQTSLTLAYQNLAEQLLGFRGDVSVANANLAQGEQDILSQLGTESATRLKANNNIMAAIWQVFYRQTYPNATYKELVETRNPYLGEYQAELDPSTATTETSTTEVDPATSGAGGATPRDAILAAFGANDDDAQYYLAHMSAGPVRQLTNRRY